MGRLFVRVFVEETHVGSIQQLNEIVAKLNAPLEYHSENDVFYYNFIVVKPIHLSESYGTVMKITLDNPNVPTDEYVRWIKHLVDKIKLL